MEIVLSGVLGRAQMEIVLSGVLGRAQMEIILSGVFGGVRGMRNAMLSRIVRTSDALGEHDLLELPESSRRPPIYQVDRRERVRNDEELQKRR